MRGEGAAPTGCIAANRRESRTMRFVPHRIVTRRHAGPIAGYGLGDGCQDLLPLRRFFEEFHNALAA